MNPSHGKPARVSLFLVIACLCFRAAQAGISGQVMEIDLDARTTALGAAGISRFQDAGLLWHNPAALHSLPAAEILASYRRDVEDINLGSLIAAFPLSPRDTLGLGLLALYGGMLDVDETGTRVVAEEDALLTVGYARNISASLGYAYPLCVGANAKYLYSILASEFKGQALAADIGLSLGLPIPGLMLGAVVRHVGTSITYDMNPDQLPAAVGGGLSWSGPLSNVFGLLIACDAYQALERSFLVHTGAELSILNTLSLRGGYRMFHDTDTFTAGVGLKAAGFRLDYAFLENTLASKHLVTFGYQFGRPARAKPKTNDLSLAAKGIALYKQGRLREAEQAWALALAQNPDNAGLKKYLEDSPSMEKRWLVERNADAAKLEAGGNLAAAAAIWRQNLKTHPKDKASLAGLARIENLAGEHTQQAKVFQTRKQWSKALSEIEQALAILPDDAQALKIRADIYSTLQKQDQQKDTLVRTALDDAGRLSKEERFLPALEQIQKVLPAAGNDNRLLAMMSDLTEKAYQSALTLKAKARYLEAMQTLQQLMEIAPDFKPAKVLYQSLEAFYQEKIQSLDKKALAAYQRGNYLEAISVWEERYRLASEPGTAAQLARAYSAQGILDYRQNLLEKAIRDWERALALDPKQPNVGLYLKRARNKINFLRDMGLEVSK